MKITKKVKARVDKLIDNILDGTDLHVDYKLLLMFSHRLQATLKAKMGSFITSGKQISVKRNRRGPEDSRCPLGMRLQSCLGAKTTALSCVAADFVLRCK